MPVARPLRTWRGLMKRKNRLSPDSARRLADHRLADFACESLLEFGHIRQYAVYSVGTRAVRIHLRPQARRVRPCILTPYLALSQEETLFRGVAVNFALWFFLQGIHQRHECQAHA